MKQELDVLTSTVNAQQASEREEKIRCNDDIWNRTAATFIQSCWPRLLAIKELQRLQKEAKEFSIQLVGDSEDEWSWREREWYDPTKVKFGFWCKMCNYPILRQQSQFAIRSLDRAEIIHGVSIGVWEGIETRVNRGCTNFVIYFLLTCRLPIWPVFFF